MAHQLQIAGVLDSDGDVYSHEVLRTMALSHVETDVRFRLIMSNLECLDLKRLTGYVDHGAIAAMAAALSVDIVIYGAPHRGRSGLRPFHYVANLLQWYHES